MKRYCACLIVMALTSSALFAQTASEGGGSGPRPSVNQMYEDIAIMGRILGRELQGRHQAFCSSCHQSAFTPDRALTAASNMFLSASQLKARTPTGGRIEPKVDGAYLKGYGVVLNLALAPLPESPTPPSKPAGKTASAWDQTKKEVRGEKSETKSTSQGTKVPNLDELLLKALADNGHNFSQLPSNEKLTIVVTFDPAVDHGLSMASCLGLAGSYPDLAGWLMASHSMLGVRMDVALQNKPAGTPFKASSARDYILLGDLQAKQLRYVEAMQAYQKALELKPEQQQLADVYRKLAESILNYEKTSKNTSSEAITKALEFLKRAQVMHPTETKSAESTPRVIASKLIISVPKNALDVFAAGRMSLEEFRAATSIERVSATAPEKKGAETKSP